MKEHHRRIFYACFCFIILFTNSCKAQKKEIKISKQVSGYFDQLINAGIQKCLNDESELYEVIKQRKSKEMYNALMESCNNSVSEYNLYKTDTKELLATLYRGDNSDFIIVNMLDPNDHSVLISKPTFTFSRKKNDKNIHFINNRYHYNESKKRYEPIKYSSSSSFNPEKKMELIEDYLYYKKENSISELSRGQPYTEYYVVARINGKYLIKTLRDYNLKN